MTAPDDTSGFADEIAILQGKGARLEDPDLASLKEREVNRRWAAMRRLGESHIYAADDLIRRQLYATDPSLRAEAINVLMGIWRRTDLLAHAIQTASNVDEHPMVRMVAIESLGLSGSMKNSSVRRLVEGLARWDNEPVITRTARTVLERYG